MSIARNKQEVEVSKNFDYKSITDEYINLLEKYPDYTKNPKPLHDYILKLQLAYYDPFEGG